MMSGNINSIIRIFVSEGGKIRNAGPGHKKKGGEIPFLILQMRKRLKKKKI